MISNISFGSTYKVTSKNNPDRVFHQFTNLAMVKQFEKDVYSNYDMNISNKPPYDYEATTTLIVNDREDSFIEGYCARNGIKYTKFTNEQLLKPENIMFRLKKPQNDYYRAMMNVEKFEELLKNQYSNIEHCESDYNKYFKEKVNFMLKSGDEIPATTFAIGSTQSVEDTIKYIDKYGAEKINENSLLLDFSQQTDEPDHCVYFALKNLGMKEIPINVSRETLSIGSALGILK